MHVRNSTDFLSGYLFRNQTNPSDFPEPGLKRGQLRDGAGGHIGRIIVEYEQNGSLRAEYGKGVLQRLSEQLTQEFGKGFCRHEPEIYAAVLYDLPLPRVREITRKTEKLSARM